MKEVHKGRASSMTVTNYKKDGRPFRNLVHVYPLSSDSSNDVTHMLGVLHEISEGMFKMSHESNELVMAPVGMAEDINYFDEGQATQTTG